MADPEGRERGQMAGEGRALDGIVVKTARRVAVAVTMSIAVGLLMIPTWRSLPSLLFLRTIIIGLSATTAFALFEVWPRSLPRWLQRWALQVVAVGVFMPVTTVLIYMLSTPEGAAPFWENSGWTSPQTLRWSSS